MNRNNIIKIILIILLSSLFCTVIQQDSSCVIFPKQLVQVATFFNDSSNFCVTKFEEFLKAMYSFFLNTDILSLENEILKQRILSLESKNAVLEQEIYEFKQKETLAKLRLDEHKLSTSLFSINKLASLISIIYTFYRIRNSTCEFSPEDREIILKIYKFIIKSGSDSQDDLPDLS